MASTKSYTMCLQGIWFVENETVKNLQILKSQVVLRQMIAGIKSDIQHTHTHTAHWSFNISPKISEVWNVFIVCFLFFDTVEK